MFYALKRCLHFFLQNVLNVLKLLQKYCMEEIDKLVEHVFFSSPSQQGSNLQRESGNSAGKSILSVLCLLASPRESCVFGCVLCLEPGCWSCVVFGAWLLVGARLTTSACPGRCGVSHTSRTRCWIFSCWQVLSPSLVGSRAPAMSSPVLVHWPPSGASVATCWRMVRRAASRQLPRSDRPPGCLRSFPSSFLF